MSIVYKIYKAFKLYMYKQEIKEVKAKLKHYGDDITIGRECKIVGGEYISLGSNVYIGPNSRIEAWDKYLEDNFHPNIQICDNVHINSRIHIGAIDEIIIKENVLFGSNVFITDHSHGTSLDTNIVPNLRRLVSKGKVIIEKDCWICENVTILPGVTIGQGSIVGAGTVVTHDIMPYSVVVGSECRLVKNNRSIIKKNER